MSIELPAPRFGGAGFAHDRDPIQPLAVLLKALRQLRQRAVELHDVARLL